MVLNQIKIFIETMDSTSKLVNVENSYFSSTSTIYFLAIKQRTEVLYEVIFNILPKIRFHIFFKLVYFIYLKIPNIMHDIQSRILACACNWLVPVNFGQCSIQRNGLFDFFGKSFHIIFDSFDFKTQSIGFWNGTTLSISSVDTYI